MGLQYCDSWTFYRADLGNRERFLSRNGGQVRMHRRREGRNVVSLQDIDQVVFGLAQPDEIHLCVRSGTFVGMCH